MKIKNILMSIGLGLFFGQACLMTSCSDWTETEAEDYFYNPNNEEYYENLKAYFKSPHKVMFGWFGNWAGKGGASMQYALCGLPDSTDFVSLWLYWGNLNAAQRADLAEFQAKGSKAIFCWRAGDIGTNLTPEGEDVNEFWGIDPSNMDSYVEAARKYALAIVDSCNKYNVDGFDYDIEDWGTLMNSNYPERANEFLRTLRKEFDKTGKMLVCDIPLLSTGWLSFYDVLENDVLLSLDYLIWQTYNGSVEYNFCESRNSVKNRRPEIFDEISKKSIFTATFEEANKKSVFKSLQALTLPDGADFAGIGAYHIEYDYPGKPDYPWVREAIYEMNK